MCMFKNENCSADLAFPSFLLCGNSSGPNIWHLLVAELSLMLKKKPTKTPGSQVYRSSLKFIGACHDQRCLLPLWWPEFDPGTHVVEDTDDQPGDTQLKAPCTKGVFLSEHLSFYPWSLHQVFLLNPTSASFRKQNSYLPITTSQFPRSPYLSFLEWKKSQLLLVLGLSLFMNSLPVCAWVALNLRSLCFWLL